MLPLDVFTALWSIFTYVWWIVVPVVLFLIFKKLWLNYLFLYGIQKLEWVYLEIKVPKNISRTPKAMEQVFSSVNAIWPKLTFLDKWWKGKVVEWFSFEMVGVSGGIYFFVRTPASLRNSIEAAIYAQYPEAEITQTEDYTALLPEVLPNKSFDLFGTNFILARENGYPIRTYEYFEDKEDERRLDPMAAITEVMSKLKEGEMLCLQILVRPAGDDWKDEAEEMIKELIGEKKDKSAGFLEVLLDVLYSILTAPFPSEPSEVRKSDAPKNQLMFLTTGKKEVVEAVEAKTAKIGYKTNFRFVYIDNRDRFSRGNVSAVTGALQQFNTKNLNAFKPDMDTMTSARWPMKGRKEYLRKVNIWRMYKWRAFADKSFVMNTEELATLYHFPTLVVEAPGLRPLTAKKAEPPPNLPIG